MDRKQFIKTLAAAGAAFTVVGSLESIEFAGQKVKDLNEDRIIPQEEYDRLVTLYDKFEMLDYEVPVIHCFNEETDLKTVQWVEWDPELLTERVIDYLKDKGFNISHTQVKEWQLQSQTT